MKNKQPLISVIVPVFKVEKYLEKCVNSITNQTYKNLEIILVDDGSPDNCPKMCDDFAKKDKRIKVVHKQNGGLSDARNAGTDISTGDLIMYVDSDDYIELNTIELLHKNMVETDSDISFAKYAIVTETDEGIHVTGNNLRVFSADEALMRFVEDERPHFIVAWCKLMKREIVGDIRYPVGRFHEDEYVTYKLFDRAKKIVLTEDTLYRYLHRAGSIMSQRRLKNEVDILDAYIERQNYFKDNKPEIYGDFKRDIFHFFIYPYMRVMSSNKISKEQKKSYKKQVLSLKGKDKVKQNTKVNLVLRFPKLMYFVYKLKNKEKVN